jgi:hypothetical protein
MSRLQVVVVSVLVFACGIGAAMAEEVRYFEQNGVTYRETRRTVRRPVTETRIECQNRTVYCPRLQTEVRQTVRTCLIPVTEYQWQAYWQPSWNPFQPPYLAQRLVPLTYWQARTEAVRTPILRQELVPRTVAVAVPVTSRRTIEQQVITRQAVPGVPGGLPRSATQLPDRIDIGQAGRSGGDASRYADESGWRPATRR